MRCDSPETAVLAPDRSTEAIKLPAWAVSYFHSWSTTIVSPVSRISYSLAMSLAKRMMQHEHELVVEGLNSMP